jgi:uncharacterized protein
MEPEVVVGWVRAAAGGAVLGLASVALLGLGGRVAGYSGILYHAVTFKPGDWVWRWVFLAGTAAAGAVALAVAPTDTAFAPLPVVGQTSTIVLAGLLVGLGTVLGGGCTSGHGICGMGRLSPRSIVSTGVFMAVGMATATAVPHLAASTVQFLGALALAAGLGVCASQSYREASALVASSSASTTAMSGTSKPPPSALAQLVQWPEQAVAAATGALFGAGLVVSRMTNATVVLSFLRLNAGWDLTLMLVMGAALPVAFFGFAQALRRPAPVCAPTFHLPQARTITLPLIAGATLFGLGWGLAGVCPGPSVVNLAYGSADHALLFSAEVLAMLVYATVSRRAAALGARRTPTAPIRPAAAAATEAVGTSTPPPLSRPAPMLGSVPAVNPFASTTNLFQRQRSGRRLPDAPQ